MKEREERKNKPKVLTEDLKVPTWAQGTKYEVYREEVMSWYNKGG